MSELLDDGMYDDNITRQIANPWVKLSGDTWKALTEGLYPIHFEKNAIIYHQGDELHFSYIVKSGRVRLSYYSIDGEEKGILIAEENCMFGEGAALPGYETYYTATAIVDCDLYLVPTNKLISTIQNDSDFAMNIIMLMARKMRIYSAQEIELSFTEAYTRTCHFLLYIADIYGEKTENGIRIGIKFTHQELANMIHASRVSVANIFSELTKNEILTKEDGYYIILKPDELHV